MSSPAKRSQYGYQLGYIFGDDQSREGVRVRPPPWASPEGVAISAAVFHRKAFAMASAACLLVSGDT
jgi:hypothetical protein